MNAQIERVAALLHSTCIDTHEMSDHFEQAISIIESGIEDIDDESVISSLSSIYGFTDTEVIEQSFVIGSDAVIAPSEEQ